MPSSLSKLFENIPYHDDDSSSHKILNVCYDLIAKLHTLTPGGCIPKVQFWTEQIKKVCMVRYGSLGHDLESVRTVMKHSKIVLRHVNGLQQSQYHDFI